MKIRYGDSPLAPSRGVIPGVVPGRVQKPRFPRINNLPPIHFFDDATIPPGGEVTLRSEALTNKTGKPIEIHEIRFSAIAVQPSYTEANTIDVAGFTLVKILFAGKPVTNAFVPMWLLGKSEQSASNVYITPGGAAQEGGSIYVWRLSKPWYLPPKATIEVQFQHTGGVRFSVHAMIGLAGSFVADHRTSSAVPFAAGYVSKPFDYAAADGSGHDYDESSERDLANITGKILNVDRIIGRAGCAISDAGSTQSNFVDSAYIGVVRTTLIRIQTSKAISIIRDYSSFRAVFTDQRSIDLPFQLDPGDFLKVSIRNDDAPTLATPYSSYTSQAFVSIVGWREEAI